MEWGRERRGQTMLISLISTLRILHYLSFLNILGNALFIVYSSCSFRAEWILKNLAKQFVEICLDFYPFPFLNHLCM